jgi:hypothetical protein
MGLFRKKELPDGMLRRNRYVEIRCKDIGVGDAKPDEAVSSDRHTSRYYASYIPINEWIKKYGKKSLNHVLIKTFQEYHKPKRKIVNIN